MDKVTKFMVFCIEEYKKAGNLSGKQVMTLFTKYQVLDYVTNYYESLHTTGTVYIIEDINLYISARQWTNMGTANFFTLNSTAAQPYWIVALKKDWVPLSPELNPYILVDPNKITIYK